MIKILRNSIRIVHRIRQKGIKYTLTRGYTRSVLRPFIVRSKNEILNKLLNKYDATVAFGPFKGMKLSKDVWWGKYDLITKMLGVYEEHVTEKLCDLIDKENVPATFIDIGAADGYFAIGMAFSKRAKSIYAFEIVEQGQEKLRLNAESNLCSDMITIKGEASYESLKEIIADEKKCVVLIDIEGAEYDLLSKDVLKLLKECSVICELHPHLVRAGNEKQETLISQASTIFNVTMIQRDFYNPNQFSDLDEFSDEQRLIAFGEGRARNAKWLVLDPKN